MNKEFNFGYSVADYYFDIGIPRKEYLEVLLSGNVLVPQTMFSFLGDANKKITEYFNDKDIHFKNIGSLFFSRKKQLYEGEQLNGLGLADRVLFDTEKFLLEIIPSWSTKKEYVDEIREVLRQISYMDGKYERIGDIVNISKNNMELLREEFLERYSGQSMKEPFNVPAQYEGLRGFAGMLSKKGIINLKDISDEMLQGTLAEKRFPYASEFIDKYVMFPSQECSRRLIIDIRNHGFDYLSSSVMDKLF